MAYKIGSFNVLNFHCTNDKKIRNDKQAAEHFCRIIKKESFDIIALQEIKKEIALKCLLDLLGQEYDGMHSSQLRTIMNSIWLPAEEYAFVWKKKRVECISDPKFFSTIYDKISRHWESFIDLRFDNALDNPEFIDDDFRRAISASSPSLSHLRWDRPFGTSTQEALRQAFRSLIRPPMVCGFRPAWPWSLLHWELRIINTHILYGNKALVQPRIEELAHVKGKIHTTVNTARFGDYRSVYTLVAGDYNLELAELGNQLNSSQFKADCEKHDMVSVQEKKTTLCKFNADSPHNSDEDCYSENYDHFSYDKIRADSIVKNVYRVDFEDFKTHRNEISDHVPISAEIQL